MAKIWGVSKIAHNEPRYRDSAQTSFQDYGGRSIAILACRFRLPAHTDHHWKPVTVDWNSQHIKILA